MKLVANLVNQRKLVISEKTRNEKKKPGLIFILVFFFNVPWFHLLIF